MTRLLLTLLLAFICEPCQRGAHYAAEADAYTVRRLRTDRLRIAAGLHRLCRGGNWCECQHRQPGGSDAA